jgi:hypothetical protein
VDTSVLFDKTVLLLDVSRPGGLLSQGEFEAKRAWLRGWRAVPGDGARDAVVRGVRGVGVDAGGGEGGAGADAGAAGGGAVCVRSWGWVERGDGRLYWLAGRPAEARPFLEEVANDCGTLLFSGANTLASYQLGEVLSAGGQGRACGALPGGGGSVGVGEGVGTARAAAAR